MMKFPSIHAAVLALTVSVSFAADKPAHLFILSGQSNMGGMDPEVGFVPEAEALFPDAEVAYIKVARGGQPIRFWVEEWNAIAEKYDLDVPIESTKYYQPILEQFAKLIEKHPEPASVTFCWMQGERDAKTGTSAAYADALKQLVANLRRDLKQPQMNIVIGRLCDHLETEPWHAVRDAQVAIAEGDRHGAWVDCDDLNDMETDGVKRNDLHYTKAGYRLLGRRYARQAKALIEGKAPAENGRPE